MSGIFAYIGRDEPKKLLADGISMLQHRGGEVNGIAVKVKNGFSTAKTVGGMSALAEEEKRLAPQGCCGIAETALQRRCVGAQSTVPANNDLYCAALSGEINNFSLLKRQTRVPFEISTDEDLLLALLCVYDSEDKIELACKVASIVTGGAPFAFICSGESAVYAHAGRGTLFIGSGENGMFLSSELAPLYSVCEKYTVIENGESVRIRTDRAVFYDAKRHRIKKNMLPVPDRVYFENGHDLSDEIYCSALAYREVFSKFVKNNQPDFKSLRLSQRSVEKLSRIIITGEGASYNAAAYMQSLLDMVTDIPSFAYRSSDFMSAVGALDKNSLLIAFSHRGETQSTINCVHRAKAAGIKTLAITSCDTSALALSCDKAVLTGCDFTEGISLRSFFASAMTGALLALHIGIKNDVVTDIYLSVAMKMGELVTGKIASAVKDNTALLNAVNLLAAGGDIFTCGVGADLAAAGEVADKIRSIASVNCTATSLPSVARYPAEILRSSTVIAFVTNRERALFCETELCRLKTLGARVILFTTDIIEEDIACVDTVISVNDTLPVFNPLPCVAGGYKLALLLRKAREEAESETEPAAAS